MVPATDDDCVFIVRHNTSLLGVAKVIDDMLQATNDERLQMEWLTCIQEFFTVSNNCDLKWYLGVNCIKDKKGNITAMQDVCVLGELLTH